jgi:hypothetical protein
LQDFDTISYGTREESLATLEEELSAATEFLEMAVEARPSTPFKPTSYFATLSSHLTYNESVAHCAGTSQGLSLCSSTQLCTAGQPISGARPGRALVPVADGVNQWVSVSSHRTCEVVSGKAWGITSVYKASKGLVACCNKEGVARVATLSQWEGFLIKSKDVASVFMVENGVRRGIPSSKTFEALGFQWPRIKTLPLAVVESIPLGRSIREQDSKGKNQAVFEHVLLGFEHDGGAPFELYEGFLIKKTGSSIVCMVVRGSKKCIPDAETFEALGFEYPLVQVIDEYLYDLFPLAIAFESRAGAAPNSEPFVHPLLGKDHYGSSSLTNTIVSTRAFVKSAVKRVFGREPTSAELLAYEKPLNATRHAPTLIGTLVKSNTFLRKNVYPLLVNALYKQILERAPTEAESASLISYLAAVRRSNDPTKNIKQIVARFLKGAEHQKRFLTEGNKGVRALYKHALGREPESDAVVESHAAGARTNGWNATIDGFLSSPEYRSSVGLYGVPGAKQLYAPAIKALHHVLLNQAGPSTSAVLSAESAEVAKDGWNEYVAEFLRSKEYIAENSQQGFMDEVDRTITLATKKAKGSKNQQRRK